MKNVEMPLANPKRKCFGKSTYELCSLHLVQDFLLQGLKVVAPFLQLASNLCPRIFAQKHQTVPALLWREGDRRSSRAVWIPTTLPGRFQRGQLNGRGVEGVSDFIAETLRSPRDSSSPADHRQLPTRSS